MRITIRFEEENGMDDWKAYQVIDGQLGGKMGFIVKCVTGLKMTCEMAWKVLSPGLVTDMNMTYSTYRRSMEYKLCLNMLKRLRLDRKCKFNRDIR